MSTCDEVHADGATCAKRAGQHQFHLGRVGSAPVTWPNEGYVVPTGPKTKSETTVKLADLAQRVREHNPGVSTGVPTEAVAAWSKGNWVEQTLGTFQVFLRQRTEQFTTPEHFWPLIDCPPEKRAMTIVVNKALTNGWLHEVGGQRLRGVYRTRDGVEFAMNKIVPVYASRLVAREELSR